MNGFSAIINTSLSQASHVRLRVFDVLGRQVAILVDEVEELGYRKVSFDASTLASGAYYYHLGARSVSTGEVFSDVKKMMVLK